MKVTFGSIRLSLLAIMFAAAALTVACGEGTGNQLPAGPSFLPGSTAMVSDDAGDTTVTAASEPTFDALGKGGNGNGNGNGSGKDKDKDKDNGDEDDDRDDENERDEDEDNDMRKRKVANGARVEVEGVRQTDGSILARKVEAD
jgi:hypothetical protein